MGDDVEIKIVKDKETALEVWRLFLIPNIIGPLSDGERQQFKNNILATLDNSRGAFFYAERMGSIVGAVGVWENYVKNGGFVIEHFAVIEKERGKGIGYKLFSKAEEFAIECDPRYITIETGDDRFYEKGRKLYERNGYKKVSHFPKYYDETSGRVDYMKSF